jgi:plasmid stabilization system protein ParE
LQEVGPISAHRIKNRILKALKHLEIHPLAASLIYDEELAAMGFRRMVCGKYLCIYRLKGDTVYVYRIVASAMNYPVLFKHFKE